MYELQNVLKYFILFCFNFPGMSVMEGKGISGGVAEVKKKFLTVYMVSENTGLL